MKERASRLERFFGETWLAGGYAIAVGTAAVSLLARYLLGSVLGDFTPYITFYPGTALLAIYIGLGPSLCAAILSLLGATYWFVPPYGSFDIWKSTPHVIGSMLYLAVSGIIIAAGESSRRARLKLERSRTMFEVFMDNSPGTVYLKDEDGRYVYTNRTNQTRFASQFVGKTDFELFPRVMAEQFLQHDLRVLQEGKAQEFIETTEEADGEHTWLSIKFPVTGADGKRLVGGKSFDITERARAQEAQLQAQRTILEQEEKLRRTEKLAAAGQLAASLAHEINNPLSSVTNALYLMKQGPALDPETRRLIEIAEVELARVSRIVRQSLSYYKAGGDAKPVDMAALVEESLEVFREKFQRLGIQLNRKVAGRATVFGFADEIRQVIDNLLLNSIEALGEGGRVAVSVRRSGGWNGSGRDGVRLTIADSGCGMTAQHLANVFEPFYTTKAEKGTGLGLWVVKGIVSKHDGSIRIRSSRTEGRSGTVISVFWPSGNQVRGAPGRALFESVA
jgi:PAS domain S-box-containing protein